MLPQKAEHIILTSEELSTEKVLKFHRGKLASSEHVIRLRMYGTEDYVRAELCKEAETKYPFSEMRYREISPGVFDVVIVVKQQERC